MTDSLSNEEYLRKELAIIRNKTEPKPVKYASERQAQRFIRKMILHETLSNTIFSRLKNSFPPIPVIQEQVTTFIDIWARHERILESWMKRNGLTKPPQCAVYRATGTIMAHTIYPRDARRLISFMIYEGEKHISRATFLACRLPDKTARMVMTQLLKEKGDSLSELRSFKSSYFSTGTRVESHLKHLERNLDRELSGLVPSEKVTGPDVAARPNSVFDLTANGTTAGDDRVRTEVIRDIPRAKDDEIIVIGGP